MKQVEADVVVLGAGAAGLAAAVAVTERGARVIAFDKAAITGGSANFGMGPFAVESRVQLLKQYSLTREEAFKIHMDFTHWHVDARLVKAFIDKSASTIDWLEEMGVEFLGLWSHGTGMNYTWHVVKGPFRSAGSGKKPASEMMKIMTERARELGVQIVLKTPVKKILKEGGRIVGAVVEDRSGEETQANAKAVIIATGGFGGQSPPGPTGLVGEGIRMAREVGAAVNEVPIPVSGGRRPSSSLHSLSVSRLYEVYFTFMQPNLMVNLLGERFMNEEVMATSPFGYNAIARQKDRTAFNIFDEDIKNYYVTTSFDFGHFFVAIPITKASNFDAELKRALDKGAKEIFVADSLEELASKAGIDPDAMRKTVSEYNKACETGRDELFNKKPRYLRPVKRPKFYVSRLVSGPLGMGWEGIKINYKTEVLTEDYEVIPGLYAAGIDAFCNVYYDTYPNVLPGNKMGFSLNSGRIAGENAAEYIKSIIK